MINPHQNVADAQVVELPGIFRRYRARISDALHSSLSSGDLRVYDMLRYYMGWVDVDGNPCVATEGKALRPTLCLFACEASGGSVREAVPIAAALELIHNFSLIHDDIQDHDETRHHRPTLWSVWGIPEALVAGNVLRVIADVSLERLEHEGVEPDRALASVGLLTEAYLEMIEGQHMDISYEGRPDIGMQDYLTMISRKTGALIRCSMNLGAVIGTHDEATVDAFRACGKSLGYVFQIRDDVLGVWGDEAVTGKPVGADIRRKKNSFPVVYAMSEASDDDRRTLIDIYRQEDITDGDVERVLHIMDGIGVKDDAQSLAAQHCDRALEAVSSVALAPGSRQELEELAHFLLVREH